MQEIEKGTILPIKVTPKAGRSEAIGWEDDRLRVRIAAVPDKGAANQELVRYLAKLLGVGRTSVRILNGTTSRLKRVLIEGKTVEEVARYLPEGNTPKANTTE